MLDTLRKDMFEASKARDIGRADILKMAMASIKNQEVEIQRDLDDDEVIAVLRKESKKIADSIEQFKRMGRDDLLEKEQYQFEVLESYLPQLMSRDDIEAVVEKKVADLGVSSVTEMGKVMGVVMNELKGKADGGLVKDIVQKVLSR